MKQIRDATGEVVRVIPDEDDLVLGQLVEERYKGLAKLREPFAPEQIGTLPKPTKKDAAKGTCNVCGKWHGLPAVHLDYVGHAVLTARLLDVDPEWTWEPMAREENGAPALDREGNLWIKLTVLGLTRPGVGDGASMKERIGDALRNAAMRFGCALELWAKEDLHAPGDEPPEPWQGWDSKAEGERAHAELVQFCIDNLDDDGKAAVKSHAAWAPMMHRSELEAVFEYARARATA